MPVKPNVLSVIDWRSPDPSQRTSKLTWAGVVVGFSEIALKKSWKSGTARSVRLYRAWPPPGETRMADFAIGIVQNRPEGLIPGS